MYYKKELVEKVKSILAGIDGDSLMVSEDNEVVGWWETSAGADFGKNKLEEVIKAIEEAFDVL